MYQVSELLNAKGAEVVTIDPKATVLAAARAMNERKIGSLVVVQGGQEQGRRGKRVIGIITERDILTRIVAAERSPSATRVEEVMTPNPITCSLEAPLEDLRSVMHRNRVRHIPVLDGAALVGMVSIGDLNAAEAKELTQTIGYLKAYIAG
jgi:CBS domain-containing protein